MILRTIGIPLNREPDRTDGDWSEFDIDGDAFERLEQVEKRLFAQGIIRQPDAVRTARFEKLMAAREKRK